MLAALMLGVGVGALAAANVGPIFLLCTRTAARFGWRPGAAIGTGAATVDVMYALLGALGAAALLEITGLRILLGLSGAVVIIIFGIRTLTSALRLRNGLELDREVFTPIHAFRTGLIATASNPITIVTWGAVFSSMATSAVIPNPMSAVLFVAGIGLGSLVVHIGIAAVAARAGRVATPRALMIVDVVAGSLVILLGLLLGVRTIADTRVSA